MPSFNSISTIVKKKHKYYAYDENKTVIIISQDKHIVESYVQSKGYKVIHRM